MTWTIKVIGLNNLARSIQLVDALAFLTIKPCFKAVPVGKRSPQPYTINPNPQTLFIIIKQIKKMHKIKGLFSRQKNANNKFTKTYYSIVSEKAGRVADIAQDGPHKGTLILWDGYAGENQSFTIIQQGGIYLIKCRNGKGYLTVESAADGARFFLSPNPTEQSKFRLDEVSPGSHTYIIYTFCNKVVDLYQGLKDNGTQIIQWAYNGNTNQQWYLNDPKNITSSSSDRP